METKRKIVFVIVEGVSDQTALAVIMSKLFKADNVIVEFVSGDITTERGVTTQNIASKIGDFIRTYNKKYPYRISDYLEIIHIIDTDGAFVASTSVVAGENENPFYSVDCIKTANCQSIIDRNRRKMDNVKRLLTLQKVCKSIPYSIYFFSCNLEHVLFNNANVIWEDKDKLATEFAKKYHKDIESFLAFIQDDVFAIKGTYASSWEFIEQGNNSLKRYTNMNLLFSNQAKNIKRQFIQIENQ